MRNKVGVDPYEAKIQNATLRSRIEGRLKALTLSPRAASLKAGLGPDAIRIILDGRSRSPRADRLQAIARALQCDVRYLLGESADVGDPPQTIVERGGMRSLPIRHEVAAGLWRERDEQADAPMGEAPAFVLPAYERFDQWLERVIGPSMNRLGITDGSLIHVVDAIDLRYEPVNDDVVVVERSRAQGALIERSVKQISIDPEGIELWGRSYEERFNVPLSLTAGTAPHEDDVTVQIAGKVVRAYIQLG